METPANVAHPPMDYVSDSSWDSVKVKRANGDEETVPKNKVIKIAVCLLD